LHLCKLTDSQLLVYFNACYPQPITWKLCHLSAVIPKQAKMPGTYWSIWTWFLGTFQMDNSHLTDLDPIPFLQLFAEYPQTGWRRRP
jgi:hypothetical protein